MRGGTAWEKLENMAKAITRESPSVSEVISGLSVELSPGSARLKGVDL
jgi:hypothetical protein